MISNDDFGGALQGPKFVPDSNKAKRQFPSSALDLIPYLKVRFLIIATVLVKYMILKPSLRASYCTKVAKL